MLSSRLHDFSRRVGQTMRVLQGEPHIVRESGMLPVGSRPTAFVLVCGPGFDQTVPNANTTCRLGWCSAFERLDTPYLLLSVRELERRLPDVPNPICWISGYDYKYLSPSNLAALARTRHIVWVDTWFPGESAFRETHDLPVNTMPDALRQKVLSSNPDYLFTISPERSFEYYRLWTDAGARLVSLPLACDSSRYDATAPRRSEFEAVEMAFVGGYWPYKARQFDRYLRRYQDQLTVFGYSRWPYAGYGGPLPFEHEVSLYRQARLSPSINEPHVELMGVDLNERVFKVLGSGGATLTDAVPAYREWFTEDELLVPRSLDEFHDFVQLLLSDPGANEQFRKRGMQAVYDRHTYVNRAKAALGFFGLKPEPAVDVPAIGEP